MGELFNRAFNLNLGGTRVASETLDGERNELLRCVFKIEHSLASSPNTAEISIYNLAEATRAKVGEANIDVEFEAGYSGNIALIFKGKLDAGKSVRDGVDWVTSFQSTDGGKQLRSTRINLSFKKTSIRDAFKRVADALDLGVGNALEKMASGNARGAITQFGNGLVLSGPAQRELDRLASTFGYSWSVQGGQIQLLADGDAIDPGDAIVVDSAHGMIGSPQAGEKGIIEVRALLNPELVPGRVVALSSVEASGFYRVERVTFTGDTRGQDWYADLELKPR